mmetsp:Transcript_39485/g.92856  ORF Transcript_39485/g.92856 Transcript_39485/m.92856 type:complete len:132 (+) Transcript_39485:639-1034(+)
MSRRCFNTRPTPAPRSTWRRWRSTWSGPSASTSWMSRWGSLEWPATHSGQVAKAVVMMPSTAAGDSHSEYSKDPVLATQGSAFLSNLYGPLGPQVSQSHVCGVQVVVLAPSSHGFLVALAPHLEAEFPDDT